jgi:DNA-binding YbaB/EbfC family protein
MKEKSMFKPNMADMFKQAQKLQDEMSRVQEELGTLTAEGSAGGGMVNVTVSGKQRILSVKIDKEVVNPDDVEMLEDLIVAAVNQAMDHSQDMAQEAMQKVTGGLLGNLPGGLKIPGLG